MNLSEPAIEARIVQLLAQRAASASICPSDVARSLLDGEDAWRAAMPLIRNVAARLAREGRIVITQGKVTLDPEIPDEIDHGPIRLRRGEGFL